jgi:hypothetical protein
MHLPGPAGDGGRGRGPLRLPVQRARWKALLGAGTGALVLAIILSACGDAGLTLAREACVHVKSSLRLYAASETDTSAAAADRTRAIEQLEVALPLAAQATSADPQWNPLMTTLQEIGRSSEANLVAALRAQCAQADTPNEQAPAVPSTLPGERAPTSPSTLPGQ